MKAYLNSEITPEWYQRNLEEYASVYRKENIVHKLAWMHEKLLQIYPTKSIRHMIRMFVSLAVFIATVSYTFRLIFNYFGRHFR